MPCDHVKIFSGKPTFQNPPKPHKFEWVCRICLEAGYNTQIISGHVDPSDDDYVDLDLFNSLKPLARHPAPEWTPATCCTKGAKSVQIRTENNEPRMGGEVIAYCPYCGTKL